MIKVSRNILGAFLIMAITTISFLPSGTFDKLTEVKVAKANTATVNGKIQHLKNSIKSYYLGLKNVGTWQGYISEARELTSKLPNGVIKDSYYSKIEEAENVVNAAATINQLEKSLESNAHVMRNVPQWIEYVDACVSALSEITVEYEDQFYNLYGRLIRCSLSIDKIIVKNDEAMEESVTESIENDL